MCDFDIEIQEIEKNNLCEFQIPDPKGCSLVGEVEPDGFKLFVSRNLIQNLCDYSKMNKHQEVGSILLGNYVEENKHRYLVIRSFIVAKYAECTHESLKFTHETWNYVNSEKASLYENMDIIGWQHSHPGFGVFLSNYDLFIHENFFNLHSQVALVIDPVRDDLGFFYWNNENIEILNGFYFFDDME